MPLVLKLPATQAEQVLEQLGVNSGQITVRKFVPNPGSELTPQPWPSGWVIAQSPALGYPLSPTTKVTLVVAP